MGTAKQGNSQYENDPDKNPPELGNILIGSKT